MASVKVAVRVRPFNQRELDHECKLILRMKDNNTTILNPKVQTTIHGEVTKEKKHEFGFDHSYWSHNQTDAAFITQKQVFEDLGKEVVDNAFEGYNACVFAYGQTGSGKTYTMMGTSESIGLIPRICEEIFNKMSVNKNKGTTYRTEVSYLEIYNERVKDLLKQHQSHSLKIREHPKVGPYVQDLSKHLVMDYRDIQELMKKGNANRTTASTNMNDVSSRSHAIFTVCFTQAKFHDEMPSETVSKVNLVDLAGSERADSSGATGQRLKEGAHINKSLVTLGSVISALAEVSSSSGKHRNVFIPYRDSVLTWLLKDSLGGNSKTMMIATLSPADINYGETLSTLRYANRAKNIINKPTINEDPNVKLIRELRAEIAKLKSLLNVNSSSSDMVEKLQENEAKVKLLTDQWEERWKQTHAILQDKRLDLRKSMSAVGVVLDSELPHLVGIEDDLLSTGITLYHLKEGKTFLGGENAAIQQDIVLSGEDIEDEHCVIELNDGVATLIPLNKCQCKVNFVSVEKPTRLCQGCVILLGKTNMFRYNDPAQAAELRKGRGSQLNLSRLSLLDLSRSANDLATSKSLESLSPPSSVVTELPCEIEETLRPYEDFPDNTNNKSQALTMEDKFNLSPFALDKDLMNFRSREIQVLEVEKQLDDKLDKFQNGINNDVNSVLYDQEKDMFTRDRLNELVEQEVQRRIMEHQNNSMKEIESTEDLNSSSSESTSSLHNEEFTISVPKYWPRGSGTNFYFEYEIVINAIDASWTIYRRYRRFLELHHHANKKYGNKVKLPAFPPRYYIFKNSEKKAEQRRLKLQQYLQDIISACCSVEGSELVTNSGITRDNLCIFSRFFQKGVFETGKCGTA